jgi:hypothetical protein
MRTTIPHSEAAQERATANVRIYPSFHRRLRIAAAELERPIVDVLCEAADRWLKRHEKKIREARG